MKTPQRGPKASRFMQITIQYQGCSRQVKSYEHRTSKLQHRILNKVFCLFL